MWNYSDQFCLFSYGLSNAFIKQNKLCNTTSQHQIDVMKESVGNIKSVRSGEKLLLGGLHNSYITTLPLHYRVN